MIVCGFKDSFFHFLSINIWIDLPMEAKLALERVKIRNCVIHIRVPSGWILEPNSVPPFRYCFPWLNRRSLWLGYLGKSVIVSNMYYYSTHIFIELFVNYLHRIGPLSVDLRGARNGRNIWIFWKCRGRNTLFVRKLSRYLHSGIKLQSRWFSKLWMVFVK